MKVFNDLKTRGVHDILIAVTDGLKGMPYLLQQDELVCNVPRAVHDCPTTIRMAR